MFVDNFIRKIFSEEESDEVREARDRIVDEEIRSKAGNMIDIPLDEESTTIEKGGF